jgi:hypothetical protein
LAATGDEKRNKPHRVNKIGVTDDEDINLEENRDENTNENLDENIDVNAVENEIEFRQER